MEAESIETKYLTNQTEGILQSHEELDCKVENSFENLAGMRDEWDRFVVDVGGHIYMSYDWCRVWWRHYGSNKILKVFIFRMRRQLVGIVPVFIEQVSFGYLRLRIAKMVGSNYVMALCDPPLRTEWAEPIFKAFLLRLISNDMCDAVWLGPLSGMYESLPKLRKVCHKRSSILSLSRDAVYSPHTVFHLPDTFESYLKSLSKSQRTYYRRKNNLLKRNFNIAVDVVSDMKRGEEEFIKFQRMHDYQWQSKNHPGHFGSWPRARKFNNDVVREQGRLGRLRLIRLIANDRVVSYQYTFSFGNCYYWRLPAREIEPRWDRYSLGHVGLVSMFEVAIKEGIKKLEGGLGHYAYKMNLGAKEYSARSILVTANRKNVLFRVRLFNLIADILNLSYYKIWRRRLEPHLPIKRGPIWDIWIRSQL